jgi:hypothetical protein
MPPRLETLSGSLKDLERRLEGDAGFDLVVLLFGVLGHIPQRERRVATLRSLRARLRLGGRLVATVPNRARRFFAEQRLAQPLISRPCWSEATSITSGAALTTRSTSITIFFRQRSSAPNWRTPDLPYRGCFRRAS